MVAPPKCISYPRSVWPKTSGVIKGNSPQLIPTQPAFVRLRLGAIRQRLGEDIARNIGNFWRTPHIDPASPEPKAENPFTGETPLELALRETARCASAEYGEPPHRIRISISVMFRTGELVFHWRHRPHCEPTGRRPCEDRAVTLTLALTLASGDRQSCQTFTLGRSPGSVEGAWPANPAHASNGLGCANADADFNSQLGCRLSGCVVEKTLPLSTQNRRCSLLRLRV